MVVCLVVLSLLLVAGLVRARRRRRRAAEPAVPQGLLRAGQSEGLTAEAAALRGGGKTAWMRSGGFG